LHGYGRDITAYITFDDPSAETWLDSLFDGCALKVFTDAGSGQAASHRRQDVMHQIGTDLHRAEITTCAPPENPREIVPLPEDDE